MQNLGEQDKQSTKGGAAGGVREFVDSFSQSVLDDIAVYHSLKIYSVRSRYPSTCTYINLFLYTLSGGMFCLPEIIIIDRSQRRSL